jgi:hypothetical protein
VLARLAPKAASASVTAAYLADLARRSENVLLGTWHRVLAAGAAEEVIKSLQSNFNRHAKEVAHAKGLIDPESSPEAILASGEPGVIAAWQGLNAHLKVITQIASVASQFGCRPQAQFLWSPGLRKPRISRLTIGRSCAPTANS